MERKEGASFLAQTFSLSLVALSFELAKRAQRLIAFQLMSLIFLFLTN